MKRIIGVPLVFSLLFLLCSCSGIKVVSDVDLTANWSNYKTFQYYGWARESDKILTRFDKERIENAFGQEFEKRGLKFVESGGDMIVFLFIVVEQKTETVARTTGMGGFYGYGPGYGWGAGGGSGMSSTTIDNYDYDVGTLVADVFDAKEEKLIWEGIVTKTIDENPQKREKTIPVAVQKMMAKFPIQPVK